MTDEDNFNTTRVKVKTKIKDATLPPITVHTVSVTENEIS